MSLVPVGKTNRYQWKPKAPVEKPGVLRRGHWSWLRGTGWETGSFGHSQPVLKACFLVVIDPSGLLSTHACVYDGAIDYYFPFSHPRSFNSFLLS